MTPLPARPDWLVPIASLLAKSYLGAGHCLPQWRQEEFWPWGHNLGSPLPILFVLVLSVATHALSWLVGCSWAGACWCGGRVRWGGGSISDGCSGGSGAH